MKREDPAHALGERLTLPPDALGEIKITLMGSRQLLAENHHGILEYGSDRVRFCAARGSCCVLGRDLRLCAMNPSELLVRGKIRSVEWEG